MSLEFTESHPVWFYFQKSHYLSSLNQLSQSELLSSIKSLGIHCIGATKKNTSLCITLEYRNQYLSVSHEALQKQQKANHKQSLLKQISQDVAQDDIKHQGQVKYVLLNCQKQHSKAVSLGETQV